MNVRSLHEKYHSEAKLQKRIITPENFTYRNTISLVEKYLKGNNRVLDIGCGVGTLDFFLSNKGYKVKGVDISTKAISIAKKNAEVFGLKEKIDFSVNRFPEEKLIGKYDFVIMSEVIEHLKDDKAAIQQINVVLKSNGILIVSTPSINAPLYKLGLAKRHDKRVGHLRRYTLQKLSGAVKKYRFRILELRKAEGLFRDFLFLYPNFGNQIIRIANRFGFFSDFLTFIDNIFLELFGESQIYLVAQRK